MGESHIYQLTVIKYIALNRYCSRVKEKQNILQIDTGTCKYTSKLHNCLSYTLIVNYTESSSSLTVQVSLCQLLAQTGIKLQCVNNVLDEQNYQ